jgi:DNA-binding response OmpR family regulator
MQLAKRQRICATQKDQDMRIAIVEDDPAMARYIADIATEADYRVQNFSAGQQLLTAMRADMFDLIMLDWNMSGMSGMDVLAQIRTQTKDAPPVIMLTSRSDKRDIATALNEGADDYIIKPESREVIAARMAAMLRRSRRDDPTVRHEDFGPYRFDYINRTIAMNGENIVLTAKEYGLANMLFKNMDRALSRSYLLQMLWNSVADLPTRTLDMHVSRIRTKLNLTAENGYRIQTVFGYGYRLECVI